MQYRRENKETGRMVDLLLVALLRPLFLSQPFFFFATWRSPSSSYQDQYGPGRDPSQKDGRRHTGKSREHEREDVMTRVAFIRHGGVAAVMAGGCSRVRRRTRVVVVACF